MTNSAKVALVTGASSGIGDATARILAAHGYRVFGASRRPQAPPGVEAIGMDVTDPASVTAAVGRIIADAKRIDLLVNNAGFAMVGAIEDSTAAQTQAIFETNVFGAMRVTRAVLPTMRAQRSGRIVNISSIVGLLPAPFSSLYAMTKHALEAFSESLDHEVRNLGIRSILLEPGFTVSGIAGAMPSPDAPQSVYEAERSNILEVFGAALAKGATPDSVGAAVLDAAENPRPKVRYPVGKEAALLSKLRRFMPTSMFEKSFRKQFRLDRGR